MQPGARQAREETQSTDGMQISFFACRARYVTIAVLLRRGRRLSQSLRDSSKRLQLGGRQKNFVELLFVEHARELLEGLPPFAVLEIDGYDVL